MANEQNARQEIGVFVIGDGRMGTIIRELVEADAGLKLVGIVGADTKEDLRERPLPTWPSTFPIKICSRWSRRMSPAPVRRW